MLKFTAPIIAVLILLSAFIFWQYSNNQKTEQGLQQQINTIKDQVAEEKNNQKKIKTVCVDSDVNEKPNDIYIKGSVAYQNEQGEEITAIDECTGSKKQVSEMWCYESPAGSGKFVNGQMIYNCPKGCLDGACKK